jgi:predicted membrane metal-binding protein
VPTMLAPQPATTHQAIHNFWTGALIMVSGVGVALLIATCGTLVSGLRGTRMWKWPALGLAIVLACFLINTGLSISAMPRTG